MQTFIKDAKFDSQIRIEETNEKLWNDMFLKTVVALFTMFFERRSITICPSKPFPL